MNDFYENLESKKIPPRIDERQAPYREGMFPFYVDL